MQRAVAVGFSEADRPAVLAAIQQYRGPEMPRVHRAILALSEGKLAVLDAMVGVANSDYRDVLYWAEYPQESTPGTRKQKREAARRMAAQWCQVELQVPAGHDDSTAKISLFLHSGVRWSFKFLRATEFGRTRSCTRPRRHCGFPKVKVSQAATASVVGRSTVNPEVAMEYMPLTKSMNRHGSYPGRSFAEKDRQSGFGVIRFGQNRT